MAMKILAIIRTIINGFFIFNGHNNRKCKYKFMGINYPLVYWIENNGHHSFKSTAY